MVKATERPTAPTYVTRALVTGLVVAVAAGLGGAYVGEDLVGWIGRQTNHNEQVLRLLGWCWIGLPLLLALWSASIHQRIRPTARPAIALVLASWAASSAILLPGRRATLEDRFGTAYPDARVLGFGWGAGVLSVFLIGAVTVAGILVVNKTLGQRGARPLSVGLTVAAVLLGAAGLVTALVAPLP